VTISVFSSCTIVCSGAKSRDRITHAMILLRYMINSFRDARTGFRKYIVGPGSINQTRNWVGSMYVGHSIDNSAFFEANPPEEGVRKCQYRPIDFVAVVYRELRPVISRFNGNPIHMPSQLIFDTGVIIHTGMKNEWDMEEIAEYMFDKVDKFRGGELSKDPVKRQKNRSSREEKRLRGTGKAFDVVKLLEDDDFILQLETATNLTDLRNFVHQKAQSLAQS
jgi:TATA-box binding protein (TBP) (component of TFIID and TFIIIB)